MKSKCTSTLGGLMAGLLLQAASFGQMAPQHATVPVHGILMDHAASLAGELPTPLTFTTTQLSRMRQGAEDEDAGIRALDHGYNPLTLAAGGQDALPGLCQNSGSAPALDSRIPAEAPLRFLEFGLAQRAQDRKPLLAVAGGRSLLAFAFARRRSVQSTADGGIFPLGVMSARDAAGLRWNSMVDAFADGNFDGGDGAGGWHFLGRLSHLAQDMTSPLHVYAQQHLMPACQFEDYWEGHGAALEALLATNGAPVSCDVLDAQATEKLDAFSAQRLAYRFNNSSPDKNNDDVRGWMEVLAWITYFRASFWGEIKFGRSGGSGTATSPMTTETAFKDGTVGPQTNVLHTMFNGRVRWIAGWTDNYYEITDQRGHIFRWMSWTDIDDWSACYSGFYPQTQPWGKGQQDGTKRVVGDEDDDRGARITGRFWFDLRELGRDDSGNFNRHCYPYCHPNGEAMTNHLHQYYGNLLFPLTVRYNASLLGLANRRATVQTADSIPASGFALGRRDNFGNGPAFDAGADGQNFYFAAKSPVVLTAPAADSEGRAFLRWLRNGSTFSGHTNRTITINDSALPIPAAGFVYTAEYEVGQASPPITFGFSGHTLSLQWPTSAVGFTLEFATNLPATSWTAVAVSPVVLDGQYAVTNWMTNGAGFYRLRR